MINLKCDHCNQEITDPRKSFIFSVEKFGVHKTNASVEPINLGEDELYFDNTSMKLAMHRMKNIYCSKCAMDLWSDIAAFASGFEPREKIHD